MLMGAQMSVAMEQTPQKYAGNSLTTLQGLPSDIKGYLLPFAITGNQMQMEQAIFTLAATCKQLNKALNNPQVMLTILNAITDKSPYVAHSVALAERLQMKEKTLPVMQDPLIVAWIVKTRASLENGPELYSLVQFSIAPIENDIERLKNYFKNRNIDINYTVGRRTPLLIASNLCNNKIIELLLSCGADARVGDDNGYTTLMHLNEKTKPETIVGLIRAGANPNIPSSQGFTPLFKAIEGRHENLVKALLENGADPEQVVSVGGQSMPICAWAVKWKKYWAKTDDAEKNDAILAMIDEAVAKKKEKLALKQK